MSEVTPPVPLLYDSHLHTPLCRHAQGELADYAATAVARRLKGIIVTCHNPMPHGFSADVRMYPEQFPDYLDRVARAREAFAGRLDVLLGLECDYVPDAPWLPDFLRQQLASAEFHYVLGSIHCQCKEYRAAYGHRDPLAFQRGYFSHLAEAAESGFYDAISHPDIVKNEYATTWDPQPVWPDICAALDRIARTGVAMELNTSGLTKPIPEMNPSPAMLAEMARRKIPVVIGSDAHTPDRVGAHFANALDLLTAAGYAEVSFFHRRQRHAVAIPAAKASLAVASSALGLVR